MAQATEKALSPQERAAEDSLKKHVVAEVRSGHNSRQHERTEISLGTWQIELKRAIALYLTAKLAAPANDVEEKEAPGRLTPGA
ncbi:hypothetical protein HJA95_21680 [Rhizobium binae]|uniref:hypothetical protein n=1 Tax=Rhizobium binae TaxID=1138190 RepID=UPI001C8342C8|nr:hypothetical protein [Rhizobium binae]MBX4952117.1 hypothetical protein [Rhizobium binae]